MSLSIVIPSLGGDLSDALNCIYASGVQPNEIIICLPNDAHSVKDVSKYKNLTIIYAQQYGQVYQRIVGFEYAKGDYVLQLDDDVVLENNTLHYTPAGSIELGKRFVEQAIKLIKK